MESKNKNNVVFVLRHGHVKRNKSIDEKKYNKQANKNVQIIKDIMRLSKINTAELVFLCSPFKRCLETASIIIHKLKKINPKIKTSIEKDENLTRWDRKESRQYSFDRSRKYGKEIKKTLLEEKNKFYFLVTHSSVIFTVVEGITNIEIPHKELKAGAIFVADFKDNKIVKKDAFRSNRLYRY